MPFKDIATLLKSSGIDLDHNRFLILQVKNNFSTKMLTYP